MNIYLFSYEFYNEDRTGLIDGGLAHEYYKWAKQLIKLGHDVTIVSTSTGRFSCSVFDGITIYELDPFHYFRRLLSLSYRVSFSKGNETSKWHFILNRGIQLFLFFQNFKKRIDIVQYSSIVPIVDLKFIPNCVRIASHTKGLYEAYDIESYNKNFDVAESQMFRSNKFIFGPSKCIADIIKRELNLDKKIHIIETPFVQKSGKLNYEYYRKIKGLNYILFFGTLGRLKGCFDLAEIIYDVLDKYKDLYFVFVGKQVQWKNQWPIDYIRKNAREYSDRIVYFNRMSHEYLFPIISGANFCLMPSKTENFSNTCVEAMSLGKIVLGSSPFFEQMIKDGETGFLCEAGDPKSIIEKIFQILDLSSSSRKIIENNAYERAMKCNIFEKTDELVKYYEYVIQNS